MSSSKLNNPIAEDISTGDGENNTKTAERPLDSLLQRETSSQRDKKISSLRSTNLTLEMQVAETATQLAAVKANLSSPDGATKTVQKHIRLLHAYNEIRDIGQGLLGLIADARGVRQIDVQKEFGVADED